jgi:predicted nucleic acid-binding protein
MFNYYFDTDRKGHFDTVHLFNAIDEGRYEGYTSGYTIYELRRAIEPKRSQMLALIEEYNVTVLDIEEESDRMADLYIQGGAVPPAYRLDGAHIAIASIHGIDCVLSYNFRHINRLTTKRLVEKINHAEGYEGVIICTAKEVLNDEVESD